MSFTITFDGRAIPAGDGQSIGAALTAAGVRSWRTTAGQGRPRGLFCGIGICFDCLVTVNGQPSLRACLQPAAPGDVITTQHGAGRDDLAG
jgi:predicted molibdopterin-dependent oxidoreductase YjgC